ncbi:MAG: extracellular solute-binding protein [Clostridium sp.]|nr:extracellular solute-binding protein [Clostridium sp.]
MNKRILASILTATLGIGMFVGCGKKNNTSAEIITELKSPISIEMWHYLNGKQAEVLDSIVKDFNGNNNMGITVSAVNQGNIGDLNKKVITASQSNSLPAIINVYPDIATGLINQNKIVDLAPYVNDSTIGMKSDIENDFYTTFINEVSQWTKGSVYGIPMTKSTEVLYVNKTMLEQLGYTMEDLKGLTVEKLAEISKKCKDELGIVGFGFDSSSNAFISTLKMDNLDFVTIDGKINVDNDWVKTFMNYYKDEVGSGDFRIPGEDKYLSGPFSNQKLLMYQGSSAGAAHIKTDGTFEVDVVEVPVFQGKNKAVIQQGASLFVTSDVSPEAQFAAYEFIKYATNTENTAKFAVATGYLPVRKSAADTQIMKDALNDPNALFTKIYPVAQNSLEYAYFTPAVNNAQSAREIIQEKYDAYVTGSIKDIDTFIKDTTSQVETSIQRQ